MQTAAATVRFAPLGRARAARRRLWHAVRATARNEAVVAAIQREVDGYLNLVCDLAFGEGLPRNTVEFHRLVVVPAVLINTAAYRAFARRLTALPVVASMEGGDRLREFFFISLVDELESAISRAAPSPKHPLETKRGWISVGMNRTFMWRIPFDAPTWAGHQYLFELTRQPITRATRKAIAEKILAVEASLPLLSNSERNDILRRASNAA